MKKYLFSILCLGWIMACQPEGEKSSSGTTGQSFFEGEIILTENQGIAGPMGHTRITFWLSEHRLKREHRHVNESLLPSYSGIIIDLEKDSVIMYYVNGQGEQHQLRLHTESYRAFINGPEVDRRIPSTYDATFLRMKDYLLERQVPDSTTMQGFAVDYELYMDAEKRYQHEIFDAKDLRIKKALLDLCFVKRPPEANFPMGYLHYGMPVVPPAQADQEAEEDRNWLKKGLDAFSKGVDKAFTMERKLASIMARKIAEETFSPPEGAYENLPDLETFFTAHLPEETDGGFDFHIDFDDD